MRTISKLLCPTLIAVLTLSGCSLGSKKPAEKTNEPIKIGLSFPLTGEGSSFGISLLGGAELAAKEINDSGGVNGREIKLVPEDDQCLAAPGATAFNKLVHIDKVTAIVGSMCSTAAASGTPIAQEAGVPVLLTIASNPTLTKGRDYIFSVSPMDDFQGKFIAEYLYNQLGKRKVAMLYILNDWGQGLRDVFVGRFQELGGEVVYEAGVMPDANDLKTEITKIKNTQAEMLYTPLFPNVASVAIQQIKELGLNIPIIGSESFSDDIVVKSPYAEGIIFTQPKTNNPEDFQNKIRQTTGKEPTFVSPYSYDAVKMLAQVIGKVGTDRKAIRDELAKTRYDESVALPVIEFNEEGELKTAEFDIKLIKAGQIVDYQP